MYVGWRDIVHAKGRFALMATVVVLISVLVGLLSGLTAGLAAESTSAITSLRAERLVFSGDDPDFATSRIPEAAGIRGEPLGVATTRVSSGTHQVPVTAVGVAPASPLAPDAFGVAEGDVVVAEELADELDLSAGDTVGIATGEFRVVAVRGTASYAHLPVVWLVLDDWKEVTGATDPTVVATASRDLPPGFTSVTLQESLGAIGSFAAENGSLQMIRGFLFAISALVVGAFFSVWTIQRSRDIAVLKALGASTGRLLRDALAQAAILLMAGVGAGAALVAVIAAYAEGTVPFVLGARTLFAPLVVLVLLGLAGAALAVRRITAVDPLEALGSAR